MGLRACIALLLFVSACATSAPAPKEPATQSPRLANLQRAATLPWTDGGPRGPDFPPVGPTEVTERERRPECKPRRVPPKGGNKLHNRCADGIEFNACRGANALVNGKAFDALQVVSGVLWEVKTDNFDSYPLELKDIVIRKNVHDFLIERELAMACGFDFRVGVRSATHKAMLEIEEPQLQGAIVLMDWC